MVIHPRMQNLCQMMYASGSGEAYEGLQPCYVRTVVYFSGSQTFSVHGDLRVSAVIFTEPLGQKKYLTLPFIKQLSPNNNYRLTFVTDSVTTFCNLDFCVSLGNIKYPAAPRGTAAHNLGIGGQL
jgi:hypothetical protein